MGGVKRVYDWLVSRPLRTAGLAMYLSLPLSAYAFLTSDFHKDSFPEILFSVAFPPAAAWLGTGISAELLKTFAYEDRFHPRTRLPDFKKRKKIKKELKAVDFESLVNKEFFQIEESSSAKAVISYFKKPAFPDTPEGAAALAKLAREEKDPAIFLSAAIAYFKQDKYDEAFLQLDKALQAKKALPKLYAFDWKVLQLANQLDILLNPRDPMPLTGASFLNALNQRLGTALYYSSFARHIAYEFDSEFKLEVHCLDALLNHALKSKNSNDVWQGFIQEVRKQETLERISETKNPVRQLKGRFLSKTILFKDKKNKSDLEAEKALNEYLALRLPDKFSVAEPFYTTEEPIDGLHTYAMRFLPGETFLEKLKKYDYSALEDIIDCLAFIHAKVPEDMVSKGRVRLGLKLKHKLVDSDLDISRALARKIVQNYRPVFNCFQDARFVYNKDAHPENWLITDDKIIVLDCENDFLVPLQFDLVNLLEYSDLLPDKVKDKAIDKYLDSYKKYTGIDLDKKEFRLIYFNSVITRAISLCSAWSSNDRKSLHSQRPVVLDNAIHAIARLKQDHKDYCRKYHSYYIALEESLAEIKGLVSVKGNH
ncbi:aminoglycoside phosphotransferase family protein [Candidatus Woesearchaeota archaeon]|nr:aminoglycoside phosphotransferase family protein [Candidatus Woesearchaeota archaeon]MBW3006181.1 aminoglycoside phosphotransferase family protein [Candidatus Woesearchaeota archaeon]